MAESITARLGLPRWSANTDTPNRTEFDNAMAALEANASMFAQGLRTARPAAGKAGRFYEIVGDTALLNGTVFYDNGAAWVTVGANAEDVVARASAAGTIPLVAKGFTGQTAALQQWRKSDDTVLASIDKDGKATVTGLEVDGAFGAHIDALLEVEGLAQLDGGVSTTTLTTSGDATPARLRSTSTRAAGPAGVYKTELNADGTGRVDAVMPVGAFLLWGYAPVPTGFLLCDGTAVSRTTYGALFALWSTTYGAGDGATTFNLPDYRDRFLIGAGPSKAANLNDGLAVGSRAARILHAISVAGSTAYEPGHVHGISGQAQGIIRDSGQGGFGSPADVSWTGHNHGGATGGGGGHDHVWTGSASAPEHPWGAMNVLVRV